MKAFFLSYGISVSVAIIIVGWLLFRFSHTNEELGIYPSPDGNAVYLDGETCSINYTPDQLIMYQRTKWCYEEYVRHEIR